MTGQHAQQPDDGHLLAPEDWAAVVAEAKAQRVRIAAGSRPLEAPPRGRLTTGAIPVTGSVVAPNNGGRRPRGAPTFGVLHDAETPLEAGYAAAIARFFRDRASTSCHYMVDPAETWGVLPDELIAWHCGTGNTNSIGVEQAGYASFSRGAWTTPTGLAQIRRLADLMRALQSRYGIGLFWMTDQQLRDAHAGRIVGGWTTHDQCRRVLGGTTHTDPMPNYPADLLMATANGAETTEENDMQLTDRIAVPGGTVSVGEALGALFHRTRAVQRTVAGRVVAVEMLQEIADIRTDQLAHGKLLAALGESETVDVDKLAASIIAQGGGVARLADEDLARIAGAVADEQARRQLA